MGWGTDPDVEPATGGWGKDPAAKDHVDKWSSIGRGMAQSATLELGDEIGSAIQAIGEKYLPESLGGAESTRSKKSFLELYRQNRTGARSDNRLAQESNPKTYLAGGLLGGMGTAAALPGGAGKTFAQLLGAGAIGGAVSGAGSSASDVSGYLPEFLGGEAKESGGGLGRLAVDTGIGGLLGAGGATVGYGAGKAAPSLLRGIRGLANSRAIDKGRKVLTNGADQLSNRLPIPDEAVGEALRSGTIIPMGTTHGTLGRLESRVGALEHARQTILSELEANGVVGPNAQELANRILGAGAELAPNTMDDAALRVYREAARKTLDKAPRRPMPLASTSERGRAVLPDVTDPGNLGLRQTEKLKGSLHEAAQFDRMLEKRSVNNARKEVASIYRGANEDAVSRAGAEAGPGSIVGEMAESFVPVKHRQGRLITAMEAAQRGAAREAQRRSPNMVETAMAASSPGGAALAIGKNLLKGRWDSTDASGAYWMGELADALARRADRTPGRAALGAGLGGAGERVGLPALAGGDDNDALIQWLRPGK